MGVSSKLGGVLLSGVLEAALVAFLAMSSRVLSTMIWRRYCSIQRSLHLLLDDTYIVVILINVYKSFRIYTMM